MGKSARKIADARLADLMFAVSPGWAAAPLMAGPAEQEGLARGQSARWEAGLKAWEDGRQEDALANLRRVLENDLRLVGPWHRNIDVIAGRLGGWHCVRRSFQCCARA